MSMFPYLEYRKVRHTYGNFNIPRKQGYIFLNIISRYLEIYIILMTYCLVY